MRSINSSEEHDEYLQKVVAPIYDAMLADPARGISSEQMDELCAAWDEEDGLTKAEPLKRSA